MYIIHHVNVICEACFRVFHLLILSPSYMHNHPPPPHPKPKIKSKRVEKKTFAVSATNNTVSLKLLPFVRLNCVSVFLITITITNFSSYQEKESKGLEQDSKFHYGPLVLSIILFLGFEDKMH